MGSLCSFGSEPLPASKRYLPIGIFLSFLFFFFNPQLIVRDRVSYNVVHYQTRLCTVVMFPVQRFEPHTYITEKFDALEMHLLFSVASLHSWKNREIWRIRNRKTLIILNCVASLTHGRHCVGHTPSIAFRHLPPNSARFGYATEGAHFISAQLSSDAASDLRKVLVLIWLRKQPSAQAPT